MRLFEFVIVVLATWRSSFALVRQHGPFDIFGILRYWTGATQPVPKPGSIGDALTCVACVSVWLSVPIVFLFLTPVGYWIVVILAISGMSTLIQLLLDRTHA